MDSSCFLVKFSVCLSLLCVLVFGKYQACVPRRYEGDSIVCVCNASYCDQIGRIEIAPHGNFVVYTSSRDGFRFSKTDGVFTSNLPENTVNVVTVNTNSTQQVIYGWGGAFTDSAGLNIHSLTHNVSKKLLRSYFSEDGIEYSLCRVPIAGSDFSSRFYTYADTPQDAKLAHFKLAPEDHQYKIPYIKAAKRMSKNKLKLIGSAWCPPLWMKTNAQSSGYGFLKPKYHRTWAEYHIKFLNAYKRHNISFWGLTTGNEPSSVFFPNLTANSLGWIPWIQGIWISEHLGPLLKDSNYEDVKIIAVDDQASFALEWMLLETLLNNADMFISGIGTHWYLNRLVKPDRALLHKVFPSKFLLNTEACAGDFTFEKKVDLGDWTRGEIYAADILEDMKNWFSGWLEWNLALDLDGGPTYKQNFVDASVIVNATAQEFYKQTTFYILGHFSKFVPPNSVKVTTEVNTDLVDVVAFRRPDHGISLIIFNKQNENVPLTVRDPRRGYIYFNAYNRSISTLVYM